MYEIEYWGVGGDFEVDVSGIAELQRALFAFNERLAERVCKIAVRQGANFMAKKIRDNAPISPKGARLKYYGQYVNYPRGRLKRAIKVHTSRINTLSANGTIGTYIRIEPGKHRNDPKGAWYAKWVVGGFNRGSKVITGREAVSRGIISQDVLDARRAQSIVNHREARLDYLGRGGRSIRHRQRPLGIRAGGHPVAGNPFVSNSVNSNGQQAARIIIDAAEIATRRLAQDLGFATTL